MKHSKKTPNAWDRFCDRVFYSRKARRIWNHCICPALEVVGYVFAGLLIAATFFILAASLVLLG